MLQKYDDHNFKKNIFRSNHRLWCGGLDVDESENFLYVGGGVEPVGSAAALGWTAVCHLGDGIRALCAAPLPSPVQEQLLQGDLVVCGGAQAAIRYLSSTSLGKVHGLCCRNPRLIQLGTSLRHRITCASLSSLCVFHGCYKKFRETGLKFVIFLCAINCRICMDD